MAYGQVVLFFSSNGLLGTSGGSESAYDVLKGSILKSIVRGPPKRGPPKILLAPNRPY